MMGRMPAYSTQSFDGGSTTSGLVSVQHGIKMKNNDNNQNILQYQGFRRGNRIGHSPSNPKQFASPAHHKRASSLLEIIREFSASYFETKVYKALYHHIDGNGNITRKIRSEFREMISMGCAILTHYYDVMTGEIGFRNDAGKYIRFSYKQLAAKLGVSVIRIKRFFKFLKDRGLVTIIEDKGKDEKGIWKSNVSRKIINPTFFIHTLGINAWKKISRYKEWLLKKIKPKTKKQTGNLSMIKNLISTMVQNAAIRKSKPEPDNSYKEKLLVEKAMILYEKDPSRSLSDYLKELKA